MCDGLAHDKLDGATSVFGAGPNANPIYSSEDLYDILANGTFARIDIHFLQTLLFFKFYISLFLIIKFKIYYIKI